MQNGSARSSMQPPQAQRVLCRRTARKTPRPDRNPVGPEVHRARLEGDSSQFRVHGRPGVTALADRRQAAVHTTPQGRSQAAYKTVRRRTSGCNKRGATSAALGNTLTSTEEETHNVQNSRHRDCCGPPVCRHGTGVRRRCSEDEGRMPKADRYEVGCEDEDVREEVKLNQARNMEDELG